jgi:hypothetical protein
MLFGRAQGRVFDSAEWKEGEPGQRSDDSVLEPDGGGRWRMEVLLDLVQHFFDPAKRDLKSEVLALHA